MGRRKTPTRTLETAAKRPPSKRSDRRRDDEPEPIPPVEGWPAPKHFNPSERTAWNQLVRDALPGVLSVSDAAQLETTAVLLAEMRKKRAKFTRFRDLMNGLDRLGMTPSGRAGVKAPRKLDNGGGGGDHPKKSSFGALREESQH